MEILEYKAGDEIPIRELFEITFRQKMTPEQWEWRFANNPTGNHAIKLMWDDDKLVGHYAVSPIICRVEGEDIPTSHSLTTMTHPEYGGKGIFKTLALALYDDLENRMGYKAVWGYPNTNSHYGFVNSLGWKDIGVIHTLGMPAADLMKHNGQIPDLVRFDRFTGEHAKFIEKKTENSPAHIKRSAAYLNWRYNDKPSVDYRNYYLDDGGAKTLVVTKVYPTKTAGLWDLNIVELFTDDIRVLPEIIGSILTSYELQFNNVTIWKSLFDPGHLPMERLGFKPVLPLTYFGARPHPDLAPGFLDMKYWYYSMGDSDVF